MEVGSWRSLFQPAPRTQSELPLVNCGEQGDGLRRSQFSKRATHVPWFAKIKRGAKCAHGPRTAEEGEKGDDDGGVAPAAVHGLKCLSLERLRLAHTCLVRAEHAQEHLRTESADEVRATPTTHNLCAASAALPKSSRRFGLKCGKMKGE